MFWNPICWKLEICILEGKVKRVEQNGTCVSVPVPVWMSCHLELNPIPFQSNPIPLPFISSHSIPSGSIIQIETYGEGQTRHEKNKGDEMRRKGIVG